MVIWLDGLNGGSFIVPVFFSLAHARRSIEDYPEELEDTLDAALEEKAALEAESKKTASAPVIPRASSPAPPPTNPQNAPPIGSPERRLLGTSNEALMNKCRTFVEQLRAGAAPWIVQQLNDTVGNMPTDASNFSFWVALVRFCSI